MTSDYTQQLEVQNEELKEKLGKALKENEDYALTQSLYRFMWIESSDMPLAGYGSSEENIIVNALYTYQCGVYTSAVVFFDSERNEWLIEYKSHDDPRDNVGFKTADEARACVETRHATRMENLHAARRRSWEFTTGIGQIPM